MFRLLVFLTRYARPSLIPTTTTASYALVDGCATSDDHLFTGIGSPRSIIDTSAAVGQVQCCATDGSSCTRTDKDGVCLGGTDVQYAEAKCSGMGMRLCQSQAEVDKCCESGCGYDNTLVFIEEPERGVLAFFALVAWKSTRSLCVGCFFCVLFPC